jgi:tRNA(fMet)-specific endonuclease VapC
MRFQRSSAAISRLPNFSRSNTTIIFPPSSLVSIDTRSDRRERLGTMLSLLIARSSVLAIDLDTTFHYARVRHELRQKGRPIPENDLWIAALASQYDLRIVSRDVHFDEVTGINRVAW